MHDLARKNIRRASRAIGVSISRFRPENDIGLRRRSYLAAAGTTAVLDIGANTGGYGEALRSGGFTGKIVSFEPLPGEFEALRRKADRDGNWSCHRYALGSASGTAEIHVSRNSVSSSLLRMAGAHLAAAPQSATTGTEIVELRRLDDIAGHVVDDDDRLFLKIDVQGYELEVLRGADTLLDRVAGIELELSMVELYEDQPLFRDLVDMLDDRGFRPVSFERGLTDPKSLQALQVDGIFLRSAGPARP